MKRWLYFGAAILILALMALLPEQPPTGGDLVWNVAMEHMDVAPPGLALQSPVTAGTTMEMLSFAISASPPWVAPPTVNSDQSAAAPSAGANRHGDNLTLRQGWRPLRC